MRIVGSSENYAEEQEHLNNVFGARLRITNLRAPEGPGVELLEYLAPMTGRPIPPDRKANDLAHWETLVDERSLNAAGKHFTEQHTKLISSGIASIDSGTRAGFLLKDPDGHVIAAMNEGMSRAGNAQGR